jgi:hypothetical protein
MNHSGGGKKILKIRKYIHAGRARHSLKLGSNFPSINQEHKPFLVDALS